jgi:hypothetical protein
MSLKAGRTVFRIPGGAKFYLLENVQTGTGTTEYRVRGNQGLYIYIYIYIYISLGTKRKGREVNLHVLLRLGRGEL